VSNTRFYAYLRIPQVHLTHACGGEEEAAACESGRLAITKVNQLHAMRAHFSSSFISPSYMQMLRKLSKCVKFVRSTEAAAAG
jgi:hypothetical protein